MTVSGSGVLPPCSTMYAERTNFVHAAIRGDPAYGAGVGAATGPGSGMSEAR